MTHFLSKRAVWRSSLFLRFFLIIIIPIIVLQSATVFIFYHRHWKNITNTLLNNVSREINISINEIIISSKNHQKSYIAKIQELSRSYEFQIYDLTFCNSNSKNSISRMRQECKDVANIYDVDRSKSFNPSDYNLLFDRGLQELYSRLLLNPRITVKYLNYFDNEHKILCILALKEKKSEIAILLSNNRIESSTTYIFVLWIIAVALLLFIIAILFVKNQLQSILNLTIAAAQISRGEGVQEFIPKGPKEIRSAGKAFLQMKYRLEKNIKNRTELLSHISHDMRTPVTRLKLQITLLDIQEKIKSSMIQNIQEIEHLLNSYLQFAKSEGNEAMERFDIAAMIRSLVLVHNQGINDKNLQIHIHFDKKRLFLFLGRKLAIQRCINNILDNALRYAKQSIDIYISEDKHLLHIAIEDDGIGMQMTENQDAMFKAFQFSESSYGLGLAIARSVVSAHGGDITLYQVKSGGLGVKISMPI